MGSSGPGPVQRSAGPSIAPSVELPPDGDVVATVTLLRTWLAADEEPPPLVVATSGSSGRPKRVLLSRAAVLASAAASEARIGGRGPWVLALPATYVAGLNVVCRSLLAGYDPSTAWPEPGQEPGRGSGRGSGQESGESGWFVSLVPTQLHRMLEDPEQTATLARAHTVLLGGGPLDPALRARAEVAGIRVVATYGAAETSGGCVYDGVPLDGVVVDLAEDGRIRLGGPTLFDGYDDDPELTAQSLVEGRFVTADAGEWGPDGRLRVLGRVDDVVVSGGVNVPGPAVAARLREHPDVRSAEVIGVPDAEWGNRLVAFVVGAVSERSLREWVGLAHPRAWAPRQVIGLDAIPMLPNGKPDRVRLRELAAPGGRP